MERSLRFFQKHNSLKIQTDPLREVGVACVRGWRVVGFLFGMWQEFVVWSSVGIAQSEQDEIAREQYPVRRKAE
jgi:hypothetical protein